ncbi:unnamed protein product [Prunus armeniaca]|uniref:Uncharacterized protein n=1 Tax=Prunus armeniaca TaxID=36596 RepID=A0A6J5V262_PRUAR|nr:unnamed protein product [Prunus armeniaca]
MDASDHSFKVLQLISHPHFVFVVKPQACCGIVTKNMSHYAGYVEDEYEMEGVDDDNDDEFRGREMGGSDSDVDEYDYLNSKAPDTTAAQARKGKDIQGIPWDRLSITREKYRQTRLEQYKNYENIPNSGEGSGKMDCASFAGNIISPMNLETLVANGNISERS